MTDEEIFDAIGVPPDRRAELAALLHAWARSVIPGPCNYAVAVVVFWHQMRLGSTEAV